MSCEYFGENYCYKQVWRYFYTVPNPSLIHIISQCWTPVEAMWHKCCSSDAECIFLVIYFEVKCDWLQYKHLSLCPNYTEIENVSRLPSYYLRKHWMMSRWQALMSPVMTRRACLSQCLLVFCKLGSLQTTLSNAFSWMNCFVFWSEFHLNVFPLCPVVNKSALFQVMVWWQTADKRLSPVCHQSPCSMVQYGIISSLHVDTSSAKSNTVKSLI